ncbi:MAG: cation-translocating P-type ATPase [Syntrophomonas sp.]
MWSSKSPQEVLDELKVDPANGLSSDEAQTRLARYGPNKLEGESHQSLFSLFIAQLKDLLIYVLLGAAVITTIIGEYTDAIIILMVVILDAVVGVFQEYKAEKALDALKKMASPHALVRRDSEIKEIPSEDIVPGDIVILDAGRLVPADIRLIQTFNLQIEESTLTGESVAVEKNALSVHPDPRTPLGDRTNMAFMSTVVTYGRGEGVVVSIATASEVGKIAEMLNKEIDESTPLQKRLAELGKVLGIMAIAICTLIFIIALFQNRNMFEMLLTAISLAVAVIPEGLPAIVAIVLALGVTRMSSKNAIIKHLPAVETLGSVNIICSDKTGTLTQNRMTVVQHYIFDQLREVPPDHECIKPAPDTVQLISSLVLCSDASLDDEYVTGDPTEIALLALADRYRIPRQDLAVQHLRVSERPFDSERKMMSTLNKQDDGYRVHVKGALDSLLAISVKALVNGKVVPLTEAMKEAYLRMSEEMSDNALRVLGAACKDCETVIDLDDMEKDLTLLGIVGMIDPPRVEVKNSIRQAVNAGITPVMITGDHKLTAFAIARELGIAQSLEQCASGEEIDMLADEEFIQRIHNYRVFARVSPEHKVKIVKAYKAHGNIVSMTGDGVNDAPSLKNADIGVAMGVTGTDVSRGASDMILADDNFTTIVHAIEEGRNIYINIRKAVVFLMSCNLGETIAILASVLFSWPIPLLPTQILWINLITDTLPAISLGVDPGDPDVMKMKPRDPKESFFAGGAGSRALIGGLLIGILTLAAFYLGLKEAGYSLTAPDIPEQALNYARTMAFVVLGASQLFYSLSMRSATKIIVQIGMFTNPYLIVSIIMGLLLQLLVISVPVLAGAFKLQMLSPGSWCLVVGLALVPEFVNELIKIVKRFLIPEQNAV